MFKFSTGIQFMSLEVAVLGDSMKTSRAMEIEDFASGICPQFAINKTGHFESTVSGL